jgi:hypothetical protein
LLGLAINTHLAAWRMPSINSVRRDHMDFVGQLWW